MRWSVWVVLLVAFVGVHVLPFVVSGEERNVQRVLGAIPIFADCVAGGNCTVDHGSGVVACANETTAVCDVTTCDEGYQLVDGACEEETESSGDGEGEGEGDENGSETTIRYVNLVMLILLSVLLLLVCVAAVGTWVYFNRKERKLLMDEMHLLGDN